MTETVQLDLLDCFKEGFFKDKALKNENQKRLKHLKNVSWTEFLINQNTFKKNSP